MRQEQQANAEKAQELRQALKIVNAHNYIVRQDPEGHTQTPQRISAESAASTYGEPSPSDMDGDSSGSDDAESAISQNTTREVGHHKFGSHSQMIHHDVLFIHHDEMKNAHDK